MNFQEFYISTISWVKESDTLPTVAKLQIYKSVILPHLTYYHLVLMALLQGLRHSQIREATGTGFAGSLSVQGSTSYLQIIKQIYLYSVQQTAPRYMYSNVQLKRNITCVPDQFVIYLYFFFVYLYFFFRNHTYQLRQTDFTLPIFN